MKQILGISSLKQQAASVFFSVFKTNDWKTDISFRTTAVALTYQNHYIHPRLHEQVQTVFIVFTGADGSATQQLFAGVFGGQRIVPVLLQVCAGYYGHQFILFIHNGQFTYRVNKYNSLRPFKIVKHFILFPMGERGLKCWKYKLKEFDIELKWLWLDLMTVVFVLVFSPFLLRCRMSLASFSVTPAGATTRSSLLVMAWKTITDEQP